MKDIYKILEELGIEYVKYEHPAVFTSEEAALYYGGIKGGHFKNLFLRNKNGTQHYMVIVPDYKKADLKKFEQKIGDKKVSFASAERMMKYLEVTPGSVTPFALINDVEKHVIVVADESVWKEEIVNFHPMINTATLGIKSADFRRFLEWCGNEVVEMDV